MSRSNLALTNSEIDIGVAMAAGNRGAFQIPGAAKTQIGNHANSTAPVAATLSNTAAGYATLGGKFSFAAVASAATDFALFAYLVPAGSTLFITGVAIDAWVTGAANATTATILDWALGVQSTAVSLATTDADPIFGPRRIPLGMQGCLAAAAIGSPVGPTIDRVFPTPLMISAGRYLHTIVAVPLGTATASEVIRGSVMFNGFFR